MGHKIDTFSNVKGGNSFYKAISHPRASYKAGQLIEGLVDAKRIALYDPFGLYSGFSQFYDTSSITFCSLYVQDIEDIGLELEGQTARPITEIENSEIDALFIAAFDAEKLKNHIKHLLPEDTMVFSLDEMRLDDDWLTNTRNYLSPENFATNFAFFRDVGGVSTRIITANYWSNYGATNVKMHLILFDENGKILANWSEIIANAGARIEIDSSAVRHRFELPEFMGQLLSIFRV